jgi:DNA-binding transcriptional regulator YdaS (Cro superfamily)
VIRAALAGVAHRSRLSAAAERASLPSEAVGETALAAYLAAHRMSQATFARQLGVPSQHVNRWCKGIYVPRSETVKKIVTLTDGAVTERDLHAAYLLRRTGAAPDARQAESLA